MPSDVTPIKRSGRYVRALDALVDINKQLSDVIDRIGGTVHTKTMCESRIGGDPVALPASTIHPGARIFWVYAHYVPVNGRGALLTMSDAIPREKFMTSEESLLASVQALTRLLELLNVFDTGDALEPAFEPAVIDDGEVAG